MYDEKPPSHNYIRNALIIAFLIGIAALFIAPLTSCYNIKKAVKQLDKAHDNYPDTTTAKFHIWFPAKEIKTTIGKPTIKTVIIHDSSAAKKLSKKIDSLLDANLVKDDLLKQVPNIDSLKEAITDNVLRECGTYNELDTVTIPITTVIHSSEDSAAILNLQQQREKLNNDLIKSNTQRDIYKGQRTTFFLAFSILLFLLITGGIIAAVRKYYKSKLPV